MRQNPNAESLFVKGARYLGSNVYPLVLLILALIFTHETFNNLIKIAEHDNLSPKLISNGIAVLKETNQLNIEDFTKQKTKTFPMKFNDSNLVDNPVSIIDHTLCKLNIGSKCRSYQVVQLLQDFWIIAPIYAYYQSYQPILYETHLGFKYYIESLGMPFCTLEIIRPDKDQKYLVSKPNNEPIDIQIQTTEEYYMRENFINVAAKKIGNWSYIGWIDAHQVFTNKYWWEEAIVSMEKFPSVQLFQNVIRYDWDNNTDFYMYGAIYKSLFLSDIDVLGRKYYHGNAFAIRREDYDSIGYILDTCIASCCDCLYVYASFLNDVKIQSMKRWSNYALDFKEWIGSTQKIFKGRRKALRGDLIHFEHESFFSYMEALDLFNNINFEVERDLKRDENMTLHLLNDELREVIHSIQPMTKLTRKIFYGVSIFAMLFIIFYVCKKSRSYIPAHRD